MEKVIQKVIQKAIQKVIQKVIQKAILCWRIAKNIDKFSVGSFTLKSGDKLPLRENLFSLKAKNIFP